VAFKEQPLLTPVFFLLAIVLFVLRLGASDVPIWCLQSFLIIIWSFHSFQVAVVLLNSRGRRGRDHMVVGFTTTCAISAYHC